MRLSLKPIEEQVMVITGASSGIGLATAQAAARAGARVLLVAREENDLRPIVARITTEGGTADAYAADVGDADALRAAAAHAAQRFGRIDTWINCAGVAIYGTLRDTPDDEHTQLFRTFGSMVSAGYEPHPPLATCPSPRASCPTPKPFERQK